MSRKLNSVSHSQTFIGQPSGLLNSNKQNQSTLTSRSFITNNRRILGLDKQELTASISIGDLNGDGINDVVVANGRHWPQQNYLFFNYGKQGKVNFTVQRPLGLNLSTSYAAVPADLDGDGDLDIAVGNDNAPNRMFFNDGQGVFYEAGSFGYISSLRSLTLADIDHDGDIDILIPCRGAPNQIAINSGSGEFPDADIRTFGTGIDKTIDVAVVDWDGDEHLDLVLANRVNDPNVILLNDRKGNFSDKQILHDSERLNSRAVAIADMNGDKNLDIIIGNIGDRNQIYFGNGSGGIIEVQEFGYADGQTYDVVTGDVDNDGDIDLIVGNLMSTNHKNQKNIVYINRGYGNEFDVIPFDPGNAPNYVGSPTYGVSVGDLNQDDFLDIVVANSGDFNRFYMNEAIA